MNHICVSPVELLCQSKSVFPSPSKSFVPTMLQGGPIKVGRAPSKIVARPILEEPFINQICDSPVEALCQRMSPRPSFLKSLLTINLGGSVSALLVVPVFSELPELPGANFSAPQMRPTASSQTPERPLMPTATRPAGQRCVTSSLVPKRGATPEPVL